MKNHKKGQVTVFIIIGIVILVGVLLFFFLRNSGERSSNPTDFESVATVPAELEPLKQYVEGCMEQISLDALELIGSRGGYIYVDNFDITGSRTDPANADVLSLGPNRYLPYWYYQDRSGSDRLRIPKLRAAAAGEDSLELQFEDYVYSELPICLNDFASFSEQNMDISEDGILEPHVQVNEDDVRVRLDYALKIDKDGKTLEAKEFLVTIPVRLGKVMRLAGDITKSEAQDVFLERATNKFISIYSGVDTDLLPPPSGGLQFTACSEKKIWTYNDVFTNYETMLESNIPYIKVAGTNFDRVVITPEDLADQDDRELAQAIYDNLIFPVGPNAGAGTQGATNEYPGIASQLVFDSNTMPVLLDLGSQGLLQPSSMEINLVLEQLCMFDYKFFYTTKFPVVVRLVDERSVMDNQPFVFEFPLQVVIKNNFPRVEYSSMYEPVEIDPGVPEYDCLDEFRDSGVTTIDTKDSRTNAAVAGASVFFQCGPTYAPAHDEETEQNASVAFAQRCLIGGTNEDGRLVTRLPSCGGGSLLTLRKSGYLETIRLAGDSVPEQNKTINLTMTPLVTVPFSVQKYYAEPPTQGDIDPGVVLNGAGEVVQCNLDSEARPLAAYEEATIRIQKIDPETGLYTGSPYISYTGGEDPQPSVDLAPGIYAVDIQLLRSERYVGEMTIPKDSESKRIDGGLFRKDKIIRYPSEDVLLPQAHSGGARIVWTVPDTVYDAQEVVFNVFNEDAPRIVEEIGAPLSHIEGCSRINRNKLTPDIITQ